MSEQPRFQQDPPDKDLSALIDAYAQGVHLRAMSVLNDHEAAKRVIQSVFQSAAQESRRAQGGFDATAFIAYATEKAIYAERYGGSETLEPAPSSEETVLSAAARESVGFAPGESNAPCPSAADEAPAASASKPLMPPAPIEPPRTRRTYARTEADADTPGDVLKRAKERLGHEEAPPSAAARPEAPAIPARTAPLYARGRKPRTASKRGNGLLIALVLATFLILVWMLGGILMDMGALPRFDLGYTYFNAHLFPLFRTF